MYISVQGLLRCVLCCTGPCSARWGSSLGRATTSLTLITGNMVADRYYDERTIFGEGVPIFM